MGCMQKDMKIQHRYCFAAGAWQIKDATIALGGMVPFTQPAARAAAAMRRQSWSQDTLDQSLQALSTDVTEASKSKGRLQISLLWQDLHWMLPYCQA